MTKIIVAGGRVGRNLTKNRVWAILDARVKDWSTPITVVAGGAAWVDTWAVQWARARGHRFAEVRIDNEKDGWTDRAPFNRNRRMYETHRDVGECLGFPGGGGTYNMMSICHDAGVPVGDVEIDPDGSWEIKWWPTKEK